MRSLLGVGIGALLGIGLGLLLAGGEPAQLAAAPAGGRPPADGMAAPASGSAAAAAEIDRLRAELTLEREMRRRLTEELEALQETLAGGDAGLAEGGEAAAGASPLAGADADQRAGPGEVRGPLVTPDSSWFSARELAALGLDEREIEEIRAVWERSVMEKLELEHQIARGELKLGPQQRARRMLNIELRAQVELGEERYEALLYATGQDNRVVLDELLASSPASAAGLEAGDEVIRYAGERVFQPRDLLRLTRSGKLGDWVVLEVLRDGEPYRFHVQRGPLGARLSTARRTPYPF